MTSQKQSGFVLITSLIFLIVLSLLGVMALRGSLFEERMSANDRDRAIAREYAEMALRDAERDILGIRFDGLYCADPASLCSVLRPAGTRPVSAIDAANFWGPSIVPDLVQLNGGVGQTQNTQGIYSFDSARACGEPVWSGADWEDNVVRSCGGTISVAVPTVPYGRFTDAPFVGPDGVAPPQGVPRPRYLVEVSTAEDLGVGGGTSRKMFFRITAVGFGKTVGPTGRNSATLQSVFSPL